MVLLGELLAICNKGEVRNLMLEFHYKDKDSGEKRHFNRRRHGDQPGDPQPDLR